MPRIPEDIDWSFVDSFLVDNRAHVRPPIGFDHVLSLLSEPDKTAMRLFDQGCEEYEHGNFKSSIELLSRSIGAIGDRAGICLVRGGANVKSGNLEEAVRDFTRAIELSPEKVAAFRSRAFAYDLMGRKDLAESDAKHADSLQRKDGNSAGSGEAGITV
jgi:tetratricopeptide (TPR) repeat protein